MRRLVKWLVGVTILFAIEVNIAAANEVKPIVVKVNNQTVAFPDAKPFIDQETNRTMIPLRFVSQSLGATLGWDSTNQIVKLNRQGKEISLKIGEKSVTVAGKTIKLDTNAVIKDNRTFVPLRFVSEACGAKVNWLAAESTVLITTSVQKPTATSGLQVPVNEPNPYFQAFHKSLKINNGMISGVVPKSNSVNLLISFEVWFKNGPSKVMQNGGKFEFQLKDIDAIGILVFDRTGKGKTLAYYGYRNLPDLKPVNVEKGD